MNFHWLCVQCRLYSTGLRLRVDVDVVCYDVLFVQLLTNILTLTFNGYLVVNSPT